MWKHFLLFFILLSFSGLAQKRNSFSYNNEKIQKVLADVEASFDVKFSYLDMILSDETLTISNGKYNLEQIIVLIEEQTGLLVYKIDSRYFAIIRKEENPFKETNILKEVVIHAFLTEGIMKQKDNSFKIFPKKMEILPGLTEPDILQTLQQLPGVLSPNETATGLHVRGGTPDQNLILWDGIKIYHNGHLFGMISGFNPNIIQSVSFYNKGTDAKYGGRVSSVIDIKTSDKTSSRIHMSVGVNALNTALSMQVPVLKNKLSVQVSGRRSFTDLYQSVTYNRLFDKVFQNTKISDEVTRNNMFYYQDYEAKLNYQFSKNDFLSISSILIDNHLDNAYADTGLNILYTDKMLLSNTGYGLSWKHKWNKGFSQQFKAYYSKYRLDYKYNKDYENEEGDFDLFTKKNKILDSGFSLENHIKIISKQSINVGYQLSAYDVSHAFLSKNPSLSFILDARSSFIQTHSLYSSYTFDISKRINLLAGVRYNYYSELKKSVFEPRFDLNIELLKNLGMSLTGEIKNQIISQIKETVVSDLSLENQLWSLSDISNFPIIQAQQLTGGFLYKKKHWTVDVDTYYKYVTGLTTLTQGFLNALDPSFHIGESKAKGIDFYVKKEINHTKAWLTYSFNTTQNRFEGINNYAFFSNNAEIKHAISISLARSYKQFQTALGWYWHTGKPYTSIETEGGILNYNELNEERLPAYHRLDFSSTYTFEMSKKGNSKGQLGLSIYNLYNRKNLLSREYTINESVGNSIQKQDKYGLLWMPNLFFKYYF